MKKTLTVTTHEEQSKADREYWRQKTPVERLDAVEQYRLEAGNSSMNIQPDFEDFLRLLEAHHVEYMIVGGYAVAFHGYPRFTKDIDVFFEVSPTNLDRLTCALVDFGFQEQSVPRDALGAPGKVLAIGVEPVRIDLLNQISGLTYSEARNGTVRGQYGDVTVTFIGLEDLIRNKDSTTRAKDKADVEELR